MKRLPEGPTFSREAVRTQVLYIYPRSDHDNRVTYATSTHTNTLAFPMPRPLRSLPPLQALSKFPPGRARHHHRLSPRVVTSTLSVHAPVAVVPTVLLQVSSSVATGPICVRYVLSLNFVLYPSFFIPDPSVFLFLCTTHVHC